MTDVDRSREELVDAIESLEARTYSIEDQARIEALLWVLVEIDGDCPTGSTDDDRIRELLEAVEDLERTPPRVIRSPPRSWSMTETHD